MIKPLTILFCVALPCLATAQNRTIDGSQNNLDHPSWGSAHSELLRILPPAYGDGISTPTGQNRPNPRTISNTLFAQQDFMGNALNLSDYWWTWGQFIDHDIAATGSNELEPMPIPVPQCDSKFDPNCTGQEVIMFTRSEAAPGTGSSTNNPRQHLNEITHFIDGSAVYGSDTDRADWLRTFTDGKLRVSSGNLLPFNTLNNEQNGQIDVNAPAMELANPMINRFFMAGDARANEQPSLAAIHTLLVREHNRLCDELKEEHPGWSDEELYQRARKIVGALIQVVTYEEFLPALGVQCDAYAGYDPNVQPDLTNIFTGAAYRMGHTLVNGQLIRLENDGDTLDFGSIDLRDAFFNPSRIMDEGGIDPFLKGLAVQRQQTFDLRMMDDLRNFLFGPPPSSGFDLVALNIQRGRERGLPDYNSVRTAYGLPALQSFSELTPDTNVQTKLNGLYSSINDLDPWIGLLAEEHKPGAAVGVGLLTIMDWQFARLRDGDRFYYENDLEFTQEEIDELKATRLSDIIKRNTDISIIQDDVFHAVPHSKLVNVNMQPFLHLKAINLKAYPNPVQRFFQLEVEANAEELVTFQLFDLNGKQLMTEQMTVVRGKNVFQLELDPQLASGHYSILITARSGKGQLQLIKR